MRTLELKKIKVSYPITRAMKETLPPIGSEHLLPTGMFLTDHGRRIVCVETRLCWSDEDVNRTIRIEDLNGRR